MLITFSCLSLSLFTFKSWRWWFCVSLLSGIFFFFFFWILECLFMLLGRILSDGFSICDVQREECQGLRNRVHTFLAEIY